VLAQAKELRQTKKLWNAENAGQQDAERDKQLMQRAECTAVVERRYLR